MGLPPLPATLHLKRRSGSRWYVRIAVPHDLREHIGAQYVERSSGPDHLGKENTWPRREMEKRFGD